MWTESGRRTEESKSAAGNFSGDQQSKWGRSSVSYAPSANCHVSECPEIHLSDLGV